jgi:peptidoglycan-associated lipoprotein
MKRNAFRLAATAAIAAAALSFGCKSTPEENTTAGTTGGFDSGDRGMGSDLEGGRIPGVEPVYFDYDRATIREDQKPTLRSNATAIQKQSGTVVIEGHCDERGSEEYNLALGERRANAVKQYMTSLGAGAASLDTVSFGESKPAVQGHDESAWRWNRRAEFRALR